MIQIQDLPIYLRGPLKSIRELKLWLCLAYLPCHGMAHRSCGPAVPGPGPVCQYGEHAMRAVLRGYSVETTGTHVTAARSSILMDLPRIPFVLLFFFFNVLASDPFGISVRTNTFSLFVATTARVWCDSHTVLLQSVTLSLNTCLKSPATTVVVHVSSCYTIALARTF